MRKLLIGFGVTSLFLASASPAGAEDVRVHLSAGVAHAVGDPQQTEFGFGAAGAFALEIPVATVLGIQAELSGLALSKGDARPAGENLSSQSLGSAWGGMLGLRLRPFAASNPAGLWMDVNGGGFLTGNRVRPGFDAHIGYAFRLSSESRWDLGPYVGYSHIIQPDSSLRPEDARVLSVGLQLSLGAEEKKGPPAITAPTDRDMDGIPDDQDACPDKAGVRTEDPKTNGCPRSDRDKDGIFDDQDACPDTPGVATDDPKTNGCPRSDRDKDGIFDDQDACPDTPGVASSDPKLNGCPPPDRDKDGVPDAEDACPDIPGVKTTDPKTNGCPAAADRVRVEGDRIVLDDVILFDTDSPRVKQKSYPIVKKVAEYIKATPDITEVDIAGHADKVGTEKHNLTLSRKRAESVKKLLVKYGVESSRLTTQAFGKTRPRAEGTSPEELQQNRRVEFVVTRARSGNAGNSEAVPAPLRSP